MSNDTKNTVAVESYEHVSEISLYLRPMFSTQESGGYACAHHSPTRLPMSQVFT